MPLVIKKSEQLKNQFFLFVIIVVLVLTGCDEKSDILKVFASCIGKDVIDSKQLHEYGSLYTICYENMDKAYSMYIFSSPIQDN